MSAAAQRLRDLTYGRGTYGRGGLFREEEEDERGLISDIGLQIVGGARDAAQSMLDLVERGGNFIGIGGQSGFDIPDLPEVDEADTKIGGLVRGISQFGTGFAVGAGISHFTRVAQGATWIAKSMNLGPKATGAVSTLLNAEINSQIADQIAFDPWGQRLSNIIHDLGPNVPISGPISEYLKSDPDDSESEARFKVALEGLGLGVMVPGIFKAAKSTLRVINGPATRGMIEETTERIHRSAAEQMMYGGREFVRDDTNIASALRSRAQSLEEAAEQATTRGAIEETAAQRYSGPVKPTRGGKVADTFELTDQYDKYAGNINLERYDTFDSVRGVMAEVGRVAEDQINVARGAPVSMKELQDLTGYGEEVFNARSLPNWKEAYGARSLLDTSAEDLLQKAQTAYRGSDADQWAFRRALSRHAGYQAAVAGIAADAGRLLRQFREMAGSSKDLRELIDSFGGKQTIDEMALDIMKVVKRHDGSFRGLNAATGAMANATRRDQYYEVWINSLLSGPQTHIVNTVSNVLTGLMTIPERYAAAAIGAVRGGADRVTFREANQYLGAMFTSLFEASRNARHMWRTGESQFGSITKMEIGARGGPAAGTTGFNRAVPGRLGAAVNIPTRLLNVEDEFFKSFGYRMELNALAARKVSQKALREGTELTSRNFHAEVKELLRHPSRTMHEQAIENARYVTYTNPLGAVGNSITHAINKTPGGRIVVPFIRTPTNIAKFALERTPFRSVLKEVRDNLATGGAVKDIQNARLAIGSVLMAGVAGLASAGYINGHGPTDRLQRQAWRNAGRQPYSFNINGKAYSFSRFEPLGMLMGGAADFVEMRKYIDDETASEYAGALVGIFSRNLGSKTFLRGITEVINVFSDPDRYGERYIQTLIGTLVPTGVAQITRAQDPVLRDVQNGIDQIRSRIWTESKDLQARLNIWGEPIQYGGAVGEDIGGRLWSPIYTQRMSEDRVKLEYERLGVRKSMPSDRISIPGQDGQVEMTRDEYWDMVEDAGQAAHAMLTRLVNNPTWDSLSEDRQREAYERILDETRRLARRRSRSMVFLRLRRQ